MREKTRARTNDGGRLAALAWVARSRPGAKEVIWRWHPDRAQILERGAETQSLPELLWSVVADAPPAGDGPSGAAYWQRRRKAALEDEWEWMMRSLPDLFRVLIELPPQTLEDLALEMGVEMVARSIPDEAPGPKIAAFLEPTGETLATRIAARVMELRAGPDRERDAEATRRLGSLVKGWRRLYQRAARRRTGADLLRPLALMQLASLTRAGLSDPLRRAARRHARSDLFYVLSHDAGRLHTAQGQATTLAPIVLELLGRIGAGGATGGAGS